jgi:hypothetical protein
VADTTPAQLSLEVHVSQNAEAVRARFADGSVVNDDWTLEPGDTLLRRDLHQAYGGSRQNRPAPAVPSATER